MEGLGSGLVFILACACYCLQIVLNKQSRHVIQLDRRINVDGDPEAETGIDNLL